MTGFSVSTLRAVMMFGIHMLAILLKRTYDSVTAAAVTAVLLVLEEPNYLYSSSFLFSFGCILTIGLLLPALTRKRLPGEKQPEGIRLKFLEGLSLTLCMLPLQLWFFYQIPGYSVFLNLCILPLMSFLMAGGFLMIAGKSVFLQEAAALLVTGILTVYEVVCRLCEKLPFHLITVGKPRGWQMAAAFLILLLIMALQRKISLKIKWMLMTGFVLLLLFPAPNHFSVTFLDVGQGDCIHIRNDEGSHYLIDGGSLSVSSVGSYRILPYLKEQGVRELDGVFITHPDSDHYNGIEEILETMDESGILIKRLYLPDMGEASRNDEYEKIRQLAREKEVPVFLFSRGQQLKEGKMQLTCLHPAKGFESRDPNEYSLVFWLEYGDFRALLTGDLEKEGERELLRALEKTYQEPVSVLKAAHHGSANATSEEFLNVFSPDCTIISCGENNRYGHPHKETLERLRACGSQIYQTMESGAITVKPDGRRLRIEEFLK